MKREHTMYQDLIDSGLIKKHNDLNCTAFYNPAMHKKPSFTYVLCGYFPGYNEPIRKIGYSSNVFERYRFLCKQSPYPLFLDYLISAPFDMEISLHKEFKDKRINNKFCSSGETEWFVGLSCKEIISTADRIYLDKTNGKLGLHKPVAIDYSDYFTPNIEQYFKNKINYRQIASNFVASKK